MTAAATRAGTAIEGVEAAAYTIPTDAPESDGTLEWDSTTIVVVEVEAGGERGLGWTYAPAAAAAFVDELLAPAVSGVDPHATGAAHRRMRERLRNAGQPGLGATALSAVDVALWDLKAKLVGLSLASLLGRVHEEVPVYGSGGFCSYPDDRLAAQLGGWVAEGIPRVKLKVGREPERDVRRVALAREAIGPAAALYVDANGAFTSKQALAFAEAFAEEGVTWFEEPVSSNDPDGLRLVREHAPPGMDVAAGEYAWAPSDLRALVGAVDCLQADVTRCGGVTGFLQAGAIAEAFELDLSAHCAPTISAHALSAVTNARHVEWFHDHVRIERMLFDGFLETEAGAVRPDPERPGLGVELRRADVEQYAA